MKVFKKLISKIMNIYKIQRVKPRIFGKKYKILKVRVAPLSRHRSVPGGGQHLNYVIPM